MPVQLTDVQIDKLTNHTGEIYQIGKNYTWSARISIFMSYDTTLVMNYGFIFPDFKYIINPNLTMTLSGTVVDPNSVYLPSSVPLEEETEGVIETNDDVKMSYLVRVTDVVKNDYVYNVLFQTPYNIQLEFFFSTQDDYDNVIAMTTELSTQLRGGTFI